MFICEKVSSSVIAYLLGWVDKETQHLLFAEHSYHVRDREALLQS